jgi:hypothetical protein
MINAVVKETDMIIAIIIVEERFKLCSIVLRTYLGMKPLKNIGLELNLSLFCLKLFK